MMLDYWTHHLDQMATGSIDVVYLDFQEAFDTVPYHRLLQKLVFMHVNMLKWIENFYLTGRNELYSMVINLRLF